MRFRRSRYYYWWQYAAVMVLAFAWMYLRDRGSDALAFFCGVGAALGFIALEVLIQWTAVRVTQDGVDVHQLRGQAFFLPFKEIDDVVVSEDRLGKAIRMGDLRVIGRKETFIHRGVYEPHKVARAIRRRLHGAA